MTNSIKKENSIFPEGLLVILIPAFAYALGFSYEAGYLSFFRVPSSFISIDISALFSTAIFVAFYLFFLLLWLSIAFDYSNGKSNVAKAMGKLMIILGFFPIIYILLKGAENIVKIISILGVIFLIVSILTRLEKKFTFLVRASSKIHETIDESASKTLESKTAFSALQEKGTLFFLLFLPFIIAFFAGHNNAKGNSRYEIITHSQHGELAVVRNYGQLLVAVPFNRELKKIKDKYVIINSNTESSILFSPQNIGPFTRDKLGIDVGKQTTKK